MTDETIRILLIEDDEDDYIITCDVISDIKQSNYSLDWAPNFTEGLSRLLAGPYDVCLIDYSLGSRTGLELIKQAVRNGCKTPMIMLTGMSDHETDIRSMKAGACDYLVKDKIDASVLERSIRYAIQRAELLKHLESFTGELKEAKEAAETSNRAKSQFLARMSHEIRTPLNIILGMVDQLEETNLNDRQREYLSMLQNSGCHLLNLINEILDLSKVEAGELKLSACKFNLVELVEQTCVTMAQEAARKNIGFFIRTDPELWPVKVFGDPDRLKQILINLIGNAVKFTEAGEVRVYLEKADETTELCESHGDKTEIKICVEDTGIGIPEEEQQGIFESFTQADESITRRFGGTGLGLAITKSLVELMGGRIWVESAPGAGSRFQFTAPMKIVRPDKTDQDYLPLDMKGKRILVADQDEKSLGHLKDMLSRMEAKVVPAHNIYDALDEIERGRMFNQPFQVIICAAELLLEDCGGDQYREIRRLCPHDSAVIVTLPLMLNNTNALNLELSGKDKRPNLLQKPVGISALFKALNHSSEMKMGDQKSSPPKKTCEYRTDTRIPPLNILLVEDSIDNRRLIEMYLKKTNFHLDMAENGKEAVEKFNRNDYDIILMDIEMPVMNGYDATREIRCLEKDRGLAATPIVALTAYAFAEDAGKCAEAGCDAHVTKPIKKSVLLNTILNYQSLHNDEELEKAG